MNIMLFLSFLSDSFVIGIMRTNEGIEHKIQNNKRIKKTTSESYLYSLGRKTTNEKMTNLKRFRHKGKPTTKTSIYIF